MKKLLSIFVTSILFIINGLAQTPEVSIAVDEVTPTSFTCTFTPNNDCTEYAILATQPGEVEMYVGSFFGSTLEEVVSSWGIHLDAAATHTWDDEIVPSTTYVVYALAIGINDVTVLYTDTLTTLPAGGTGPSVITLSVTDIGDTSATTTATPNDQTSLFKDMIVTRQLFEEQGINGISYMLQAYESTYYATDTWTWRSLTPGTEYYFIAMGMNANGEWGELASFPFTTTGESGVAAVSTPTFQLYPNPATDFVHVNGLTVNSKLSLFDMQGRKIQQVTVVDAECELSLNGLPSGLYFVSVQKENGVVTSIQKLVISSNNR